MKSERTLQIQQVYNSVLEQAPDQQSAFLAAACEGDEDLRRQVESLLAQNAATDIAITRTATEVAADQPETPSDLTPGMRLGPYQILGPLGEGGMGKVYRGLDTRLDRQVAIKISVERFGDRFEREARAISALNHPHICTLYDVGPNYLVMELVDGETLRGWLKRAPSVERTLEIAKQVLGALGAAHRASIVHRDLKPANIMVRSDGFVKVLDFGLAKRVPSPGTVQTDRSATLGPSVPGQIVGTAAYMSPEQILGREIDQRSDLFAFGIILYEMLAGQHPWPRTSRVDTLHAILHDDPAAMQAGRISTGLAAILEKLLRRNAAERYSTADAVLEDLASSAAGEGVARNRTSSGRPRRAGRKRIQSLAVLPLANLSGGPEHEYFADGMTDALITTLAQIGALRVISRTSVMQFKGTRKPLPDIARELNVEVVLEGSVLRSGDRVRIAAQLIDAPTDTHLWAKTYESDLRDILATQSEVAQAVAKEIKITLAPQERARLSTAHRVDPEAYEAFLKGRYHWYRRSIEALNKSLECFQHALAIDPTYPLAHAGIADTYNSLGWDLFAAVPPVEAFPKARIAAQKALELDPNCAEAHAALGWAAAAYDWDWVTAEHAFRRALDLKPQYGPAHIWYSHLLHAIGRIDESLEQGLRAIECDPLGLILNVHMGWHHVYQREYQRAIEQLHKTLELDPGFLLARLFLGEAYEKLGRFEDAIDEFEKGVTLSGRRPVYLAGLGHAYAASGRRDSALKVIEELQELSSGAYVPARGIAEIFIGLGEKVHAFEWLDKAVAQRNGWLFHIKSNPRYDSLRSDPRFTDLVRRIGLP